jgi:hypothetical protein
MSSLCFGFYIYSPEFADFATAEWQLFSIVKKYLYFSGVRIWVNSCGVNPLGLCEGFWGNFHEWDELRSLIFFHELHKLHELLSQLPLACFSTDEHGFARMGDVRALAAPPM